jgi:uncharacterized SAM-binding protein YcdF (DUF218 family)
MFILKTKYFSFVGLMIAIALVFNSCSFSGRTTGKMLYEASTKSYDLIIVPGVPLENGKWSDVMKARIYWSKYLFDKGIAKNVMYSGAAVYTPFVEAEVMALYAEAIGIPKENIFTESKAEHSTENIYYSFKKAKKLHFKKIALASDPFQTKMLQRFTRSNVSESVEFIPIVFDTLRKMEPTMVDPTIDFQKIMVNNFVSLPDRKSFLVRFRGTMGKDLDEMAYE